VALSAQSLDPGRWAQGFGDLLLMSLSRLSTPGAIALVMAVALEGFPNPAGTSSVRRPGRVMIGPFPALRDPAAPSEGRGRKCFCDLSGANGSVALFRIGLAEPGRFFRGNPKENSKPDLNLLKLFSPYH
jgi:hypothetical protein